MDYPVQTPWGKRDGLHEIAEGIAFVATPSHGGVVIHESIPLSPAAKRRAVHGGRWYFFEEDCDWAVATHEIAALQAGKVDYMATLVAWNPDYLMEMGIDPTTVGGGKYLVNYMHWLERKYMDTLRLTKSPDLIVVRYRNDDGNVTVTTADGATHIMARSNNKANRLASIWAEHLRARQVEGCCGGDTMSDYHNREGGF